MEYHSKESPYYPIWVETLRDAARAEERYVKQVEDLTGQRPTERQIAEIWYKRNLTASDRDYYFRVVLQLY